MIIELTAQISSSEALSTFWSMMEFLLDQKLISADVDFKISSVMDMEYMNRSEQKVHPTWNNPKSVLFFRLSHSHSLYMEAHRRQYGKNGVDLVSLMHYIKHHQSYLGYKNSVRFKDTISSCYCFDYDILGRQVNLDRLPIEVQPDINADNRTESQKNDPF
jgi:hypothetical protein